MSQDPESCLTVKSFQMIQGQGQSHAWKWSSNNITKGVILLSHCTKNTIVAKFISLSRVLSNVSPNHCYWQFSRELQQLKPHSVKQILLNTYWKKSTLISIVGTTKTNLSCLGLELYVIMGWYM